MHSASAGFIVASSPIGRTSTAITLYSGHEVLTSAEEPISRFVRVSGKWNVVKTWPRSIRSVTWASISIRPWRLRTEIVSPCAIHSAVGVVGVDLEHVAVVELEVARAAGHRAGVVVLQAAAGDEDQRELVVGGVARLLVGQRGEVGLAAGQVELVLVEDRRVGAVGRDRPLQARCGRCARR